MSKSQEKVQDIATQYKEERAKQISHASEMIQKILTDFKCKIVTHIVYEESGSITYYEIKPTE